MPGCRSRGGGRRGRSRDLELAGARVGRVALDDDRSRHAAGRCPRRRWRRRGSCWPEDRDRAEGSAPPVGARQRASTRESAGSIRTPRWSPRRATAANIRSWPVVRPTSPRCGPAAGCSRRRPPRRSRPCRTRSRRRRRRGTRRAARGWWRGSRERLGGRGGRGGDVGLPLSAPAMIERACSAVLVMLSSQWIWWSSLSRPSGDAGDQVAELGDLRVAQVGQRRPDRAMGRPMAARPPLTMETA